MELWNDIMMRFAPLLKGQGVYTLTVWIPMVLDCLNLGEWLDCYMPDRVLLVGRLLPLW